MSDSVFKQKSLRLLNYCVGAYEVSRFIYQVTYKKNNKKIKEVGCRSYWLLELDTAGIETIKHVLLFVYVLYCE